MTRGRIFGAILLVALAGLFAWIANNTYWVEETAPARVKGEALRNPFYALQRFSESLGMRTEWRRSFGELPPTDAVIVLWAWHWSLIDSRREALKRWVAAGGRLVVDGSLIGGRDDIERWSGIALRYSKRDSRRGAQSARGDATENDEALEDEDFRSREKRCSELGVGGIEAAADGSRERFRVCSIDAGRRLVSNRKVAWLLRDDSGLHALRVDIGRGSLTVLNGTPFRNEVLLDGDHGALFAALTQMRRGDAIYFYSDEQGDSLISLAWRFGAPAIALLPGLVALALWRGGARFGPLAAQPELARRSLAEQIRGTGRFTLRHGGGQALHAAAVRALLEAASRRIARFDLLPADERLAALARAARVDEASLARAMSDSGPRRPGELRNTVALLESARRMILNTQAR